jgi:glycine cleavage system H protein
MNGYLVFSQDKFTFRVATDRLYNPAGVWAKADGDQVTTGVSDFFQQRNGDVAFTEVLEVGTAVAANDDFATIETIKVDVELPCPVSGTISDVNEILKLEAEAINQDPYGRGWLAKFEAVDWTADQAKLLSPEAYLEQVKNEAEEATN